VTEFVRLILQVLSRTVSSTVVISKVSVPVYVEGVVESFVEREGCPRYEIRVDRDVFGGEDFDRRVGNLVYPPVNGTPSLFGDECNNVELA